MDGDPRLEQLDKTLEHLDRLRGRLEHAERQFKQLTDECQSVLQGLVAVDRRHSSAIAGLNERLSDWCNLESKLLEESARRIEQFERGVSHEWMVLRQLNEEPIAELREHADTLRRTCLEAAQLARLRLEAAEQAYASHAAALERRMVEWQRRWLDAASTRPALAASADAVEPWPLEGVAQLHQELRTAPGTAGPGDAAQHAAPAAATSARVEEPSAGEPAAGAEPSPRRPLGRRGVVLVAAAGLVVVVAGLLFLILSGRNAPSPPAAGTAGTEAAEVTPTAAPAVVPPDADAEREQRLAEAQRLVERAGSMVDILAAPDLLRYGLSGTGPGAAAYAQVLWSRSRGVAVTASRLPPAPAGKTYTMWVISESRAVAVGILVPDATGRASLVIPGPLALPRLVALRVTLEEGRAGDRPAGPVCLVGGPSA